MMFFDLNIPFSIEREGKSLTEKESIRNERLKITMKALELGYTSVAYNRRISGVLSDSDKCNIDLFPISKLLKLVPDYFSSSVNFHRELLGVPVNSQFRQYKRVTIDVQSSVQAAWINAGNPVLRTFDLVAVRPLNQVVFDQACQDLEVDLISLNFTQMLPFHLKLPLVQAAIKRGIYFEVSYASFISDDQARRHMLQGVKLLVAGTHGKNLIFTSSASTVNGIRGPNDVANLSTLFGLSIEYAKASVSKNCRSLITNSLRRKQCYKESFEVQRPPPYDSLGFENSWLNDWHILDEGADVPTEELFSEKVDQRQSENFVALGGLAIEMPLEGVLFKVEMKQGKDLVSAADIMPLEQVLAGKEEPEHIKDLVQNDGPTIHIPKSDDTPLEGSLANTSRKQGDDLVLIADVVPLEKVLVGKEEPEQTKDLVAIDSSIVDMAGAEGILANTSRKQGDDLDLIADVIPLEKVLVGQEEPEQTKDLVAIDSSIVDMAGADVMPQEEVIAEMEELKHATEPVAIDGPTMHMPRSDVIPQEEVAVEMDELEHTADPVMVDGPTIHIPRSDEWWRNFGIDDLELQTLAIRILSQTCSSSGCERNWSVFERIHTKRRNRLAHKRLNDLVYTHYNLRLKERQASRKSLTDPISLENIDLTDDWVVEAEDDDAPLLDVDEIDDWMDVADAILDEGEGGAAAGKHRFKRKSLAQTYPLPFRGILKSLLFKRKPRKVLKWRSFL